MISMKCNLSPTKRSVLVVCCRLYLHLILAVPGANTYVAAAFLTILIDKSMCSFVAGSHKHVTNSSHEVCRYPLAM